MKLSLFWCLVVLLSQLAVWGGCAFELKVCSVDDLRKSLQDACIRFARDSNSQTNVGPYGAQVSAPNGSDPVRPKRNSSKRRERLVKRHRETVARDYVSLCCSEGCKIGADTIASMC